MMLIIPVALSMITIWLRTISRSITEDTVSPKIWTDRTEHTISIVTILFMEIRADGFCFKTGLRPREPWPLTHSSSITRPTVQGHGSVERRIIILRLGARASTLAHRWICL